MKKWEITRDDYEDQILGIEAAHRREITEYEADLQAAQSRVKILEGDRDKLEEKLDIVLDENGASQDREARLRNELVRANKAWTSARNQEREVDAKYQALAGHLSRIRAAEDGLHKAVYPTQLTVAPLTTFITGPTPAQYTMNKQQVSEPLEDRIDRLHEAGYPCYQDGEAQAQAVGYSGLR